MDKPNSGGKAATNADITGIMGRIDSDKLLQILSLHPTVAEVEEAAMWLSGDSDVFGANLPKGNVSDIVTILTVEEEEEEEQR